MEIDSKVALLSALGLCFVTISGYLKTIVDNLRALWRTEPKLIIGIYGETPKPLFGFKDFTSYLKALRSNDSIVLLHSSDIAYLLRKCDFVAYNKSSKLYLVDDPIWEVISHNQDSMRVHA